VPLLGINIGKTKLVDEAGALADYTASTERLGPHADYLVVNVSSPNTPGLRDLQAVDKLRPLLAAVRATLDRVVPGRRVPLLVKIAPDLADADVDAVADLALELGLDGIIATNTTIARTGLRTPAAAVAALGAGGLSGPPVAARALAVLRRLRARVGDRLVLIAVGGVETADDVWGPHHRRRHPGPGLHRVHLWWADVAAPDPPRAVAAAGGVGAAGSARGDRHRRGVAQAGGRRASTIRLRLLITVAAITPPSSAPPTPAVQMSLPVRNRPGIAVRGRRWRASNRAGVWARP